LLSFLVIDRLTVLSVNVHAALTYADIQMIFMGAVQIVSVAYPSLCDVARFLRMLCSVWSTYAGLCTPI
jgi:hypothetical protein